MFFLTEADNSSLDGVIVTISLGMSIVFIDGLIHGFIKQPEIWNNACRGLQPSDRITLIIKFRP